MKSIALIFLFLLLSPIAWSQDAGKTVVPLEGTQAFLQLILHQEFVLTPLKSLQDLADKKPEETMIIVFGDTAILDDIGSLEKFRSKGGAVLIASDRNDRGRLWEWELSISGEVVSEKIGRGYKLIPLCPMIKGKSSLFQGITQGIATNKPSYVQYRFSEFKLLAGFPEGCWSDRKLNLEEVGFLVGRDGALVMAGHSVFMNMLLGQLDNDNFKFARNCVRWLAESPQGKRKYALFVEDGRIVSQFDVGLTVSLPMRFPPTMVLNRVLRGLEDESFFNRLVDRFLRRDQILRTLLLLATLVLLVYGCKRLVGARHRIETAVPLLTPLPSPVPAIELTLPVKRQQALMQGGNLWEPARELARFFFDELAQLPPLPHGSRGNTPPPFSASGGWLQRRWLNKQVHYLWQLAHGKRGQISKRRFRRLPVILDHLAMAVRSGRLRFG
jgi:hypothetical protein